MDYNKKVRTNIRHLKKHVELLPEDSNEKLMFNQIAITLENLRAYIAHLSEKSHNKLEWVKEQKLKEKIALEKVKE